MGAVRGVGPAAALRGPERAAWWAGAIALVGLSDIYVATYALGTLLVAFAGYHLVTDRARLLSPAFVSRAAGGLVAAGAVLMPYYASLVSTVSGASATAELRASVHRFGQDVVQLLLPAPWNPWLGSLCGPWQARITNTDDWGYLGWVPLALAAVALWRRDPRLGFWLCFGGLALFLSLGTSLHLAGPTGLPLPYELAGHLPLLQNLRAPGRFEAFAELGLAVMAAIGAAGLWRRAPRLGPYLVGLLVVLGGFEAVTFFPFPSTEAAVPAYYEKLAAQPPGGLLELPVGDPSWGGPTQHWMYYQSVHHRPLVYGHAPRPTDEALAFSRSTPVVRELIDLIHTDFVLRLPPAERPGARERLAGLGIREVILHHESIFPPGRYEALATELDALFGPPVYRDDKMIVYRLS